MSKKIISKIVNITLVFLMVGAMLGGLATPINTKAAPTKTWYVEDGFQNYLRADQASNQLAEPYTSSFTTQSAPAGTVEFHVTTSQEFQAALDTAETNGEDDIIYLAAGTYEPYQDYVENLFEYAPPDTERKSLTIRGEPGTTASDVILNGQSIMRVLDITSDASYGSVAEITVDGITVENGYGLPDGGGIRAHVGPLYIISVRNCIIKNNTSLWGGGISMFTDLPIILENNLILDNTVLEHQFYYSKGGGVAITNCVGYYLIRNNTIAGNSVQGTTNSRAGGLYISLGNCGGTHYVDLIGNTIYDNQANEGGGVLLDTRNKPTIFHVYNNIIYGNTATDGGDIYFTAGTNGIGYNNDYSDMYGDWTESGSNLDTDPAFLNPANDDYHLTAGSPCIDAGTSSVPDPPGLPDTDIEGNPRVSGAAPDMGAYEWTVDLPFARGDILLCRSPFSPIPGEEFTHAGIYVGNGKVIEAVAFETEDFYGKQNKGVIETKVETWMEKPYVAYLSVITATPPERDLAATFAESQVGDEFGILLIGKSYDPDPSFWYCSELVWAAYMDATDDRIDLDNNSKGLVWPDEIYQDDDTERIGWHYDYWPLTLWDGLKMSTPEWAMWLGIRLQCPADLEVVDPDGLLINKQSIDILGAIYGEDDSDGGGTARAWIYIPTRKTGDYLITVVPEPGALPTDTYTLEVLADGEVMVLADDVPISDIPSEPYVFESDVILPGDANGDGVVNNLDITKVERIIVGLDAETPGADANQDGVVNNLDITKVERIIVGLD